MREQEELSRLVGDSRNEIYARVSLTRAQSQSGAMPRMDVLRALGNT